jgi:hypothetical protein
MVMTMSGGGVLIDSGGAQRDFVYSHIAAYARINNWLLDLNQLLPAYTD